MDKTHLEEENYLGVVLKRLDTLIQETDTERKYNLKEVEDIGIPDLEQRGYFRKCKEKAFKCEEKINSLKEFKKNTHFGRMDLSLKDDAGCEDLVMYLGEKSVNDGIHNLVYDWRSPVGNLYYMSSQEKYKFNETEYELNLKRQIEINNSKLVNVYNSFLRGSDLNVTDDFLIKVLENKKNRNEFADIIKTIQSNQNSIIRDDLKANQIVQGVAGSGKTVVLLHRLSYLLYNYPHLKNNKLIFITPSRIFQSKLTKINRSLSLTELKMFPMEEYYLEKIKQYIPSLKIDQITNDVFDTKTLNFIYSDEFPKYVEEVINDYLDIDIKLEARLKRDYETGNYESKEEIIKKINRVKDLKGKNNVKKVVDIIFTDLKNKFKFKNTKWINNKKCIKAFAYVALEVYNRYGFTSYNDYEFLFIDEMQDYSYNEYSLINRLEKRACLNLYGDVEQAILPHIKKKTISELEDFMNELKGKTVSYRLNENYRNSREITAYVNEFLNVKMNPMGISSDSVKEYPIKEEAIFEFITSNFENSCVVLSNNDELRDNVKSLGYETYSIREAKGLEFSKVIVVLDNFSYTEKYVAFTRTLDKLFVLKVV